MLLVNVEIGEDELYYLVGCCDEGIQEAVDVRRIRTRVVGTTERAALLAVRRREADARTTCTTK